MGNQAYLDPLEVRRGQQQRPRQVSLVDDGHYLVYREHQLGGRAQARRGVGVQVVDGVVQDAAGHLDRQEFGCLFSRGYVGVGGVEAKGQVGRRNQKSRRHGGNQDEGKRGARFAAVHSMREL